jgi:hypothetical protein
MTGKVDISSLFKDGVVMLPEHDEERQARIRRDEREHLTKIRKGWIVFVSVFVSYFAFLAVSLYLILWKEMSPDTTLGKFAWLSLTSLVSSLAAAYGGYAAGQK